MTRPEPIRTSGSCGDLLAAGDCPVQRKLTRFGLPVLFVVAGLAALSIDVPAARWVLDNHCPRTVVQVCSWAEMFAHGLGVLLILITVFVLDPASRRFVPRLAAAALGSGLLADVFKLSLARERPYHFNFQGGVAETFGAWFPHLGRDAGTQSFPSSHVAVAAGLAIALAWRYPRGRWLFVVFAILAAGQRLTGKSHFLSDVCWGAATGCLFAPACLPGGLLDRPFARLEARFGGQSNAAPHQAAAAAASDHRAAKGSAKPHAA